jgi:cell division protein FtsB
VRGRRLRVRAAEVSRGRRLLVAAVVAGMAWYAVQGGEYSTTDLLSLRRQVRAERDSIARLRLDLDSLRRERQALASDPRVQERVARQLYGMLRPGEILYQVVPADTTEK